MSEKEQNMIIWDKVSMTNPKDTKGAKIGQLNITSICPQSQRKSATEVFGAYGYGWGIVESSEKWDFKQFDTTTLCTYTSVFWYMWMDEKCTFPINSTIKVAYMTNGANKYMKIDDDYSKKAQTDALTKGLSFLGFNSDIFEGKFDDAKYRDFANKEMNDKREWLNEGEAFDKARVWVLNHEPKDFDIAVAKIEEKYKLSKETKARLKGEEI